MMKLNIQMFSDGSITIDTKLNTKDFENGLNRIQGSSKKAGSTIKSIVAGLGIAKVISKGMQLITSSVNDAVKRVDVLNNFPKVMKNLGISTEDSSKAINKMSEKLAGLPTTLDQGASAVQRFTSKNGDVKKSTDIFLALNNAILAGGAPTEQQATALEQLSQAYAKGKPDMMEWRSLQSAMPAQLKQVAIAMGYAGGNVEALGEDLRNGNVSMDKFMDAIVQLNKKGVKGFQSFEKQARNSTAGIGTAITVAKTQIVKGVADIMTGIDKGLKKSGTSISKIVADFGKTFKKYLDEIANRLSKVDWSKVFKTLATTIKVLIPLVATLTAGFLAYNGALKLLQLKQTITNLASLSINFTNSITAINGAKVATEGLNTALTLSPLGLVLAGVTGLTAGILVLSKVLDDNATGVYKINKHLEDYKNEIKETDKARQDYLNTNMTEVQDIRNLYNELQLLTDENGKVKEGYEDRVKYILGQLSEALGTEIKLNGNVVEGYKDIEKSVKNVILAKRAKVLLDAQEESYNKAKERQSKLEKDYANAVKETNIVGEKREVILEKIGKQYGLNEAQLQQVNATMKYFDENGKQVNISLTDLGKALAANTAEMTGAQATLMETGNLYQANQKVIGDYEQALIYLKDKNYEAVVGMFEDTTEYIGKTKEETIANYTAAIEAQSLYLEQLEKDKDKYDEETYKSLKAAGEARLKTLTDELKQHAGVVAMGVESIRKEWISGTQKTLSDLAGRKIEFKDLGNGFIQSYVDGHKAGAPVAYENLEQFGNNIKTSLEKSGEVSSEEAKKLMSKYSKKIASSESKKKVTSGVNDVSKTAKQTFEKNSKNFGAPGLQSSKGYADGMTSKEAMRYVDGSARRVVKQAKSAMESEAKIKSPSRLFRDAVGKYISLGVSEGIDDYSYSAVDSAKTMADDIYKEMQRAVSYQTDKMATNIQTSGTYQVAMAGMPTFNLKDNSTNQTQLVVNGKVLAEVVNTENRNREVAKS